MAAVRGTRAEDAGGIAALRTAALLAMLPDGLRVTVVRDAADPVVKPGFVAEDGGGIVGVCEVEDGDLTVLVAPGHRGAGVGRALVAAALDDLRSTGRKEAGGWIAGDDADALAFAARLGFRPTGATRGHGSKEAPEVRVELALDARAPGTAGPDPRSA